jgi:transcriptional regulator with XRE-family HTH domain
MNKKHPDKEYKMKVGENILYWRKLKGLKQEDLAERIGISPTALSNIENGVSKPDIERLEDIADALEIEVSQLLTNPQQMFTFNNSPQSNGVIYSSNSQSNVDKDLLDRVVAVMEKITSYFTGNGQKTPS